jgi:hypothetical protein
MEATKSDHPPKSPKSAVPKNSPTENTYDVGTSFCGSSQRFPAFSPTVLASFGGQQQPSGRILANCRRPLIQMVAKSDKAAHWATFERAAPRTTNLGARSSSLFGCANFLLTNQRFAAIRPWGGWPFLFGVPPQSHQTPLFSAARPEGWWRWPACLWSVFVIHADTEER